MKEISRLHYITTSAELAEKACKGGVTWVQLRLKNTSQEAFTKTALEVQEVCKQYKATLIINDNVQLALAIGADGVHLGKEDMPYSEARRLLGNDYIIGGSTNTLADIIRLSGEPVDYIGLGPYRFTTTRQNLNPIIGMEGYQAIFFQLKNTQISIPPVIGIGGIEEKDVTDLLAVGLHGIAVSGAISHAIHPTTSASVFTQLCNKKFSLLN